MLNLKEGLWQVFTCYSNHHLCSQMFQAWDPFLSALRIRKDRNLSLGQPPEKSRHWTCGPVQSFPSQGKSGDWVFPFHCMMLCWQLGGEEVEDYGERVSWPFLLALMCLVSCLPRVQEPLSGFLDLPQWNLVSVLLFNHGAHGRRRFQNFLFFLLTDINFLWNTIFSLISVRLYILFLLLGWKLSLPFLSNIQIAFKTMVW